MANPARHLSYERTTKLVARALGLSPDELEAAFVPARREHLPMVMALRRTALDAPVTWDDERYLTWRYRFGSTDSGRGECWVALRAGQVVGLVGTEDVEFQLDDGRYPAASTMDIAVHSEFEGSGLGAWMTLALARRVGCGITIGSNAKSRHMIVSLLSRLPDRRTYLHALDFHRFYERRIRPRFLANIAASLSGAAMGLWRGSLPGGAGQGLEIRRIRRFDAAFDDLLARARRPGEVSIRRSADWLNWRLFGNPRMNYAVWAAYLGSDLKGFMATQTLSQHSRHDALSIVDWAVDPAIQSAVFYGLLRQVLQVGLRDAAEFVQVTAYRPDDERSLRRSGFFAQKNEFETVALFGSDTTLIGRLSDAPGWFLTESNTDRDGL